MKYALALSVVALCAWAEKQKIVVTTVSGEDQISEGSYTRTSPGTSNTNCGVLGQTVNCQTTTTPPRTTTVPVQKMYVRNIVDGDDGMRYAILCTATWNGSNCFPMQRPGEQWGAEVDGKTMWIFAQKGGNMGKRVKVKFTIIDKRPAPLNSTKP